MANNYLAFRFSDEFPQGGLMSSEAFERYGVCVPIANRLVTPAVTFINLQYELDAVVHHTRAHAHTHTIVR